MTKEGMYDNFILFFDDFWDNERCSRTELDFRDIPGRPGHYHMYEYIQ